MRHTNVTRMAEAIKALALCHNVTPVAPNDDQQNDKQNDAPEADRNNLISQEVTYQASSPDEVALVQWSESVGLTLIDRDLSSMRLRSPTGQVLGFKIMQIFPFTSETKRMGIIVQVGQTNSEYDQSFLRRSKSC